MSCDAGKITKKKKIILFSSLGVGVAVAMYFVLTTTNNPALAAGIPTVLAFGTCPLLCAAMGGAMWLSSRFSKNKNKHTPERPDSSAQKTSCCEVPQENREQQEKLENGTKVEEMKRKNSIPIPKQQNKLYEN